MSEFDRDNAGTAVPDGAAKLDQHHRQQLSALLDGALAPDEARFLLRRLQHDATLAACWERWHLAGEVLRGRTQAPLPAGFSARVAAIVALEPPARRGRHGPASAAPRHAWRHGLGVAALAASVAVVALFVARPLSVDGELPAGAAPIAAELHPAPGTAGTAASTGRTPAVDDAVAAPVPSYADNVAAAARTNAIAAARQPDPVAASRVPTRNAPRPRPPATIVAAADATAPVRPDGAPLAPAAFARPPLASTLPSTRPWPSPWATGRRRRPSRRRSIRSSPNCRPCRLQAIKPRPRNPRSSRA
jgi:negative regulator of sigma E activity